MKFRQNPRPKIDEIWELKYIGLISGLDYHYLAKISFVHKESFNVKIVSILNENNAILTVGQIKYLTGLKKFVRKIS